MAVKKLSSMLICAVLVATAIAVSSANEVLAEVDGILVRGNMISVQLAADGGTGGIIGRPIAAGTEFVPGEILVGFRADVAVDRMDEARRVLGATTVETFPQIGVQRWSLMSRMTVDEAIRALSANPAVQFVEPNYIWHAVTIPNDPLRSELWGLHNIGQTGGTLDADIDALEAWDVETGTGSVVVGIIDGGVDYNHEDLTGNIWINPGEDLNHNGVVDSSDFNGIDDDKNGYVDDLRGWDCVNNDNDPMDDDGHGTHVSGTVGALGNNGKGVAGVNWNVKLMPLKFLNAGGSGSTSDAIECINYAAKFKDGGGNNVVRITSNSWGGFPSKKDSTALQNAIANSGALFVAAAGNSGSSSKEYPAGYSLNNIVSVAATDDNDILAGFSNYGSDWVDLGAPGVDVVSSVTNNGYKSKSGTSMATPHVSGAAALLLAHNPGWTNSQLKSQILATVDPLPSLQGKTVSGGRLNVRAALGAPELPPDEVPPAGVADLAQSDATYTSITLSWTATGDDGIAGTAYSYDLRYRSGDALTEDNWATSTVASGEPNPQTAGSSETFTLSGLSMGVTYYVGLKVGDEVGSLSPLSNVLSASTLSSGWNVQIVAPWDPLSPSPKQAHAYDPKDGNPSVAYTSNYATYFAHWNGLSWQIALVDSSSAAGYGVDLAYDPSDGNPSICYGKDALRFAHWNGVSWVVQVVEGSRVMGTDHSLVYDGSGNPRISYQTGAIRSTTRTMKLASWNPATGKWILEAVDSGRETGMFNSLAIDPTTGYPAIAYSEDLGIGTYWPDALKFARWTGTSWNIQIVESGVEGYGASNSLAFDPVTGYPTIVHYDGPRLARWDGASWTIEVIGEGECANSLAYDAYGVPYVSYVKWRGSDPSLNGVKVTHWDGSKWIVELVDTDLPPGGSTTSIAFSLAGHPSVSYIVGTTCAGCPGFVKYAWMP